MSDRRSGNSVTYDVLHSRNTPAWVSAIAAMTAGAIAVLAVAAAPSESRQDDHEQRIRQLETLTAQELSSINTQLRYLNRQMRQITGSTPPGWPGPDE